MPISTFSTPPQTSDPTNFDPRADLLLGTELPRFVTEANTQAIVMTAQEASATSGAAIAAAAATAAQAAQVLAQAMANYKGAWATLTGALAIPASVLHQGTFWALSASIANVATETPGVSSSWVPVVYPGGVNPDQQPRGRDLGTAAFQFQTWLHASATYDPGSVSSGGQTGTTIAVPGAAFGDFVHVSLSISAAGMQVTGYISAADVVTLIYQNTSGGSIDLASHTVYVRLMKRLPE